MKTQTLETKKIKEYDSQFLSYARDEIADDYRKMGLEAGIERYFSFFSKNEHPSILSSMINYTIERAEKNLRYAESFKDKYCSYISNK